jgi:hypothetical protein
MKLRSFVMPALLSLFVTVVACSSDDTAATAGGSSCEQASKVADDCNAKPSEGGVKVTINFDKAKCESSDQAKKAAQCIADNKTNCDCFIKCQINGSCT